MSDPKALVEELRFGAEYGCEADLIERAADAIEELVADLGDADAMTEMWMKKYEALQAQLPKRGKWKCSYPEIEPNPMFMYGICSICGFEQSISDKLNYCPNCGAKMNGEQNVE